MNLHNRTGRRLAIVRVGETRLMYPLLADFSGAVIGADRRRRARSADRPVAGHLRRQRDDRLPDGSLPAGHGRRRRRCKLAGVQKRVETMLTMTGAQNFLEIHADEASAVKSFGS